MIEIQPTDTTEIGLERVARLLREEFPTADHLGTSYLDWLYNQNPLGSAIAYDACQDGQLIGHYAGIPVSARYEGIEEKSMLGVNAVSRVSTLSRGLFLRLISAVRDAGRQKGVGLVYGSLNRNSVRALRRSRTIQTLEPMDVKIGIGAVPPSTGEPDGAYRTVWSRESVRWRIRRPGARYWRQDMGHETILLSATSYPGVAAILGRFPTEWIGDRLPKNPATRPFRVWIGVEPGRTWTRRLYLSVPQRWRSSPLVLSFVDFTDADRRMQMNKIRLHAIDFDLY